jgi:methylated-DNA-[protein]-cysteine S-methyltransferase
MTTATDDDIALALTRSRPDDPDLMERLHTRLAAAAQAQGILDVAYRTIDTPIGTLLVAATEVGLVRVAFATEDHAVVLQALGDRISPRVLEHPARLDPIAQQLDEYFAGRRRIFEMPIDWRLSAGFRSVVLHHLAEVAYGRTVTYAAMAQLAGNPKAVRAVGSACATNPLPVVIPCHRVVRSDGTMGGYLGGLGAKRALLALESAAA